MAFDFQGSFSTAYTNYAIWGGSSERPLQIDKQAQNINSNISVLLLNLLTIAIQLQWTLHSSPVASVIIQ